MIGSAARTGHPGIQIVLLDSGPLGIITNPKGSPESAAANAWVQTLVSGGVRVFVPEIADYELRRKLMHNRFRSRAPGLTAGLIKLNDLTREPSGSAPILWLTRDTLRLAAEMWGKARHVGKLTSSDEALDGDMILTAQAVLLCQLEGLQPSELVIATTNPKHFQLFEVGDPFFVAADIWQNIKL